MGAVKIVPQTNQEAFDMAVRRLGELPERAMDPDFFSCSYVAGCAVGCMVESMEDRELMDTDLKKVRRLGEEGVLDVGGVSLDMLEELQMVHDSAFNWDEGGFGRWEEVGYIADCFGLSTDVLEEVSS